MRAACTLAWLGSGWGSGSGSGPGPALKPLCLQVRFLRCRTVSCHWLVLGSTCVEQLQVREGVFTHNPPSSNDSALMWAGPLTSDLALRCLLETAAPGAGPGPGPVLGLAVALCCHHRCEWRHYVGQRFFGERGLGAAEFAAFCRMSSWATCGHRPGQDRGEDEEHEGEDEPECVSR